jgi:hypothetical protein
MGSFFMIKKEVFEAIGTYKSVRDEIQEDRAIGNLLKGSHYKIKMFKVDSLVSALWSRDVSSLWHGIRRSITPAAIEDKLAIISHQLILFAMIALPFSLLPYNAVMLYSSSGFILPLTTTVTAIPNVEQTLPRGQSAAQQNIQDSILKHKVEVNHANDEESTLESALFWFNLSLCLLIAVATGIKGIMKYRLVPLYSFLCVIGSLFLIASYAYSTLPLMTGFRIRSIEWRGRSHDFLVHYNEENKIT